MSERKMSVANILRVSMLNLSVALLTLPLGSTLNRVMITELALPATFAAVLIAMGSITSPLRIWFGHVSDIQPLAGRHRTWYIALGIGLMAIGLVLAPQAIYTIPTHGNLGLLLTTGTFVLVGLGINATTPLYLAVVSDQANEIQRPRIIALMFTVLGVGVVIGAFVIGDLLDPYSPERLTQVMIGVAAVSVLLAVIGLVGLERKTSTIQQQERSDFGQVRALLLKNRDVAIFFVYLLLTFIAIDAQDVILEPYAATAFGMTPGESAALTGILRSGFLVTLIAGAFLVNRYGHKATAGMGIAVAIVAFGLLIGAGQLAMTPLFMGAVFGVGLGNGLLATANLTLMLEMTDHKRAGVYIGLWGFAQAVGVGSATLVGGIVRDVAAMIVGPNLLSYFTVFSLEILLLIIAVPVLRGLNTGRFRATSERLSTTQVLSGVSD